MQICQTLLLFIRRVDILRVRSYNNSVLLQFWGLVCDDIFFSFFTLIADRRVTINVLKLSSDKACTNNDDKSRSCAKSLIDYKFLSKIFVIVCRHC